MEAATSGSQEVVDLLLSAGADPMVRDKDGVSPLMSAAAQVSASSGRVKTRVCRCHLLVGIVKNHVQQFRTWFCYVLVCI